VCEFSEVNAVLHLYIVSYPVDVQTLTQDEKGGPASLGCERMATPETVVAIGSTQPEEYND
jgi:hypothetical protein